MYPINWCEDGWMVSTDCWLAGCIEHVSRRRCRCCCCCSWSRSCCCNRSLWDHWRPNRCPMQYWDRRRVHCRTDCSNRPRHQAPLVVHPKRMLQRTVPTNRSRRSYRYSQFAFVQWHRSRLLNGHPADLSSFVFVPFAFDQYLWVAQPMVPVRRMQKWHRR